MDESDGLLNRCTFNKYLGFESRSLRSFFERQGRALACAAVFLIAPVFAPFAARAQTASQSATQQYLSLRRAYPPRADLTPAVLKANPSAYRGMTLELSGRLSGVVRSDNGGASLMLQTRDFGGLTMAVSFASDELQAGRDVRVLAV